MSRGRPRSIDKIQAFFDPLRTSELPKPGELMTATQIADLTNITPNDVMSFAQRRVIKAVSRTNRGWMLYDVTAVHKILDYSKKAQGKAPPLPLPDFHYSGEQGQIVFRLLREGKTADVIVIETGFHPRLVRGILKEHDALAGAITVYKHMLDRMNELDLDGNFPLKKAEDIYHVMELASREYKCRKCRKARKSQLCSKCERKEAVKMMKDENLATAEAEISSTLEDEKVA